MPLEPNAKLLAAAVEGGYAVPHFNICNLETVQAVAEVVRDLKSPVIFGIHPVESAYAGADNLVALISSIVRSTGITAGIHLDHSPSFDEVVRCVRAGYTSVMFDGSTLPLEENIRTTREVVRVAHLAGVSVEAEIGTIGATAEYGAEIENPHLADPDACAAIAETGIDALAVAIGNAHGVYIAEPKLDFDRLKAIRRKTDVPLVLHGGSGIPVDQVQQAIKEGVAKFNVGTAIHVSFTSGLRESLAAEPDSHNMMQHLAAARDRVKPVLREYVGMAMSEGRAG